VRPNASRWLLAIALAAALGLVVPALAAAADTSVLDVPASAQPAAPAGEVTPTAETTTEPAAPAADPTGAAGDEITAPADGGSAEAPAPPPSATPVADSAPIPGVEATPTAASAPSAGTTAGPATPLPVTPDAPSGSPTTWTPEALAPAVPADRLAAVSAPSVSVAPTAPDDPGTAAAAAGPVKAVEKATTQTLPDLVSAILHLPDMPGAAIDVAGVADVSGGDRDNGLTALGGSEATVVDLGAPRLVAPPGAAPAGSSLLSVLAGYVLPGVSGPPASTLVLFIVVGLILGVSYAACPQLSERLAPGNLLGASTGHRLAVRRPG